MKKVTTKQRADQNILVSTRPHSRSSASQSSVKSQDFYSTCDSKTDHILCEDLHKAKRSPGWSRKMLAERKSIYSHAIARLERGIGSLDNLIGVINELGDLIVGIGPRKSLPGQLHAQAQPTHRMFVREEQFKKWGGDLMRPEAFGLDDVDQILDPFGHDQKLSAETAAMGQHSDSNSGSSISMSGTGLRSGNISRSRLAMTSLVWIGFHRGCLRSHHS
nr:hypothetical protein [Sphingorhabdus sp. M41]